MATREVTRARVTATILGTLTCIALIAFVYAFVQQGVAKQQRLLADKMSERAIQCERHAGQMKLLAEQQRNELQKRNEIFAQELLKLRDSKIK